MSDQASRGDRMPWLWSFGPAARDDAVGSTMRNGWVTAGAAMIVMWWVPAACGQVASSAGAVWCDRPLGHVVRVADAPVLDGDDPLAEAVWQQVQPIGRLFSKGQPEPADRATDVRMLVHGAVLYVAARCLDPQADGIARGEADQEVWQADSLELIVTQSDRPAYPYINVQINAGGRAAVVRYLRPCGRDDQYGVAEPIDPALLRVRSGVTDWGWWTVAALPMKALGIPAERFFANIMRNRPSDGSDFAWRDLWGGWSHRTDRLGRIDVTDHRPAPQPSLHLPTRLAVGANRLILRDWQPGYAITVGRAPVEVGVDGSAEVCIERHGSVNIKIHDTAGHLVRRYHAEVARPLIVEAAGPFVAQMDRPIEATVWLAVADPSGTEVTVEVMQGVRCVGRMVQVLASGEHAISIACNDIEPGEVRLRATARVADVRGGSIRLAAEHWCVIGQQREAWDRFGEGIDALSTQSVYRSGLADACNFYRILQSGDGRYRSWRRSGRLGSSEWSYGFCYAFALLYKMDWPENPYRGDRRFLAAAAAGMEAALDPATWYEALEHPRNRQLQGYLLTYALLADDVPAEQARYWESRLSDLVDATVTVWIKPVSYRTSRFSSQTGTGTNHYAYHASNVYTAGVVLDRPQWRELGQQEMLLLAGHERDGHFPERRVVPATHYTWMSMNALGQYYWQSGDERVLPSLRRCVEYCCHTSLPNGDLTLLHDGRVIWPRPFNHGDFVLSLTARGRHLARARAMRHIGSAHRPSRSSPEYWYRTAENARYFKPGDEQPMPTDGEFFFLDGHGLIARRNGFLYGLNALSVPPIKQRMYWVDPQNAVELHHREIGPILAASNSQEQPEAGSFHRVVGDRVIFMPKAGRIERTDTSHEVVLEFDTFIARLEVDVVSPTAVRLTVHVLEMEGDAPVIYSFFPAVGYSSDVTLDDNGRTLRFGRVVVKASKPLSVERDFKIINPYSLKHEATIKPVRAWVAMRQYQRLVLDIAVSE